MTVTLAMDALKTRLESELADGFSIQPKVFLGMLPEKDATDREESYYSFIIIQMAEANDELDKNETRFRLIFGTVSQTDQGYLDVVNLMERVRISLLRNRVLDSRYRLELPYKSKVYDDQFDPYWLGEALTIWTLPTVLEEVEGL